MNTNLSTSYTALQSDRERLTAQAERGWQAEQAAASGSSQKFTLASLSGIATSIVNSIHEFVDPRGFAMKVYAANQRLTVHDVPTLAASPIAEAPMPVAEQSSGAVIALPTLRPVAPDALDTPAAA